MCVFGTVRVLSQIQAFSATAEQHSSCLIKWQRHSITKPQSSHKKCHQSPSIKELPAASWVYGQCLHSCKSAALSSDSCSLSGFLQQVLLRWLSVHREMTCPGSTPTVHHLPIQALLFILLLHCPLLLCGSSPKKTLSPPRRDPSSLDCILHLFTFCAAVWHN